MRLPKARPPVPASLRTPAPQSGVAFRPSVFPPLVQRACGLVHFYASRSQIIHDFCRRKRSGMVRGNARAARAMATASPDSSSPLGDRGRLGRPGHAVFFVSLSAGATQRTKSVVIYIRYSRILIETCPDIVKDVLSGRAAL